MKTPRIIILSSLGALLLLAAYLFAHMSGTAKSRYILKTQRLYIPWHEAVFLDVQIRYEKTEHVKQGVSIY